MSADVRGAAPDTVRGALASGDPLPGTAGFAGELDGRLLRDVLGRQPLFYDEPADGSEGLPEWSFSPTDLSDPRLLPAGTVLDAGAVPGEVWSLPDPPARDDPDAAVSDLATALRSVLVPDRAAVAFSGGVDSGVVAALVDGPLYVAGFPDSHDVGAARDAARAMGRSSDLTVVELSHDRIESAAPRVVRATGRTNAMDVSIALPLFVVAARAAADGHDHLAVGQGADELFGGYAKVAKAPSDPRVDADRIREARRETVLGLPDQLARDVPALRAAGVEPVAPMLHDRVVETALGLPPDLLVDDRGERKVALRWAAREFVPDVVAFRQKKAVQYGSLVARELDRLARQAGYKRRMDDHVSQYLRSLVGDEPRVSG